MADFEFEDEVPVVAVPLAGSHSVAPAVVLAVVSSPSVVPIVSGAAWDQDEAFGLTSPACLADLNMARGHVGLWCACLPSVAHATRAHGLVALRCELLASHRELPARCSLLRVVARPLPDTRGLIASKALGLDASSVAMQHTCA